MDTVLGKEEMGNAPQEICETELTWGSHSGVKVTEGIGQLGSVAKDSLCRKQPVTITH